MRRTAARLASLTALCVGLSAGLTTGSAAAQDDDVAARVEAICCGATCCLIDGMCRTRDEQNPANGCQVCDPSMSQTQWTDMAGCGGTDAGPAGTDAGPGTRDAGPDDSGGGGCHVSRGATGGFGGLGLALIAAAGLVLRRRRARSEA